MEEKNSLIRQKKFAIPLAVILMAGLAMAIVYIATVNVNVTVGEPLSVTSGNIVIANVFPNDVATGTITIQNDASVVEYGNLIWTEDSNPNNVAYTVTLPSMPITLNSGANNAVITFAVNSDSNVGDIVGHVNVTRTHA